MFYFTCNHGLSMAVYPRSLISVYQSKAHTQLHSRQKWRWSCLAYTFRKYCRFSAKTATHPYSTRNLDVFILDWIVLGLRRVTTFQRPTYTTVGQRFRLQTDWQTNDLP